MIDIRPAESRAVTATDWLDSRHSFAFGQHYDPANTGFALLVASNDDVLAPGGGFTSHQHRDLEIVTWVLDGELVHTDDQGNRAVITPGVAQRISAGTGIEHTERNGSSERPVRYVQMWLLPDETGVAPSYEQRIVGQGNGLLPVASGRGHDAIGLRQRDAVLWLGRLAPGQVVALPEAACVHLFVATGDVVIPGAALGQGDAARLTSEPAVELTAVTGSELLIWEMHSPAG